MKNTANSFHKPKTSISSCIVIFLFFAIAFLFLYKSPLHPWVTAESNMDSSVFKTVALMMKNRYMPYKNTFDHKGPLLYLINYLGLLIGSYKGVWIFEFLSLVVTLWTVFKTALLTKCNYIQAFVSTVLSTVLLYNYFQSGNLTEEYAMPLIAISIFIFVDYLLNNKVTKIRLSICGICFGLTCLLRVNMTAIWIVFCIYIFILCLYQKQYLELRKFILWFIVGFCIALLPFMIWLACNHAQKDFWNAYIVFNVKYLSGRSSFAGKWTAFFTFGATELYLLSILSSIFLAVRRNKRVYSIYTIFLIINLLTTCLLSNAYGHYAMVLVPTITLPIAGIFLI